MPQESPESNDLYEKMLNAGPGDLKSSALGELKSFLGLNLTDAEIYQRCKGATEAILTEWREKSINPRDEKKVTQFYQDTQNYCYELIGLEIDAPAARRQQLEDIAQFLARRGNSKGCDYGSGVGTLGIYLNRRGLVCDFADVSETNLAFVRQRLKQRGIQGASAYHLMSQDLPDDSYDFITSFDVLEHVPDPVALIGKITSKLRPGGLFLFNVLCEEEENTPHILHDINLIRKNIRQFGLEKRDQLGEFKVYEKTSRPAILNKAIHAFDCVFWEARERLRSSFKSPG